MYIFFKEKESTKRQNSNDFLNYVTIRDYEENNSERKYNYWECFGKYLWNIYIYMFGTNSICYQRPKAGYET